MVCRAAEGRNSGFGRDVGCRRCGRNHGGLLMKHIGLAGAAVLAIALSGPVLAQSVGPTDPGRANTTDPNSARVQIAPEQRTRIKEYVAREKVAPVTVQERVRIGSRLPAMSRYALFRPIGDPRSPDTTTSTRTAGCISSTRP